MVVCCQVAVQPCNVRVSGESNEVLCEYLMNYKLDYTQKPQVLDNMIQNYLKNIIAHPDAHCAHRSGATFVFPNLRNVTAFEVELLTGW